MAIPPQLKGALQRRMSGGDKSPVKKDSMTGGIMAKPSIPGMGKPSEGFNGPRSGNAGGPVNGLPAPNKAPPGPPTGITQAPPENAGGNPNKIPGGLTLGQNMPLNKVPNNPFGKGPPQLPGGLSGNVGAMESAGGGPNTGNAPGGDIKGFGAMARRIGGGAKAPGSVLSNMLSGPGKTKLSPNNKSGAGPMLNKKGKGKGQPSSTGYEG